MRCTHRHVAVMHVLWLSMAAHAMAQEVQWTEVVISPRQVAEPALAIRLFPDDSLRRPGNAAPIVLRMAWEQSPKIWELYRKAPEYLEMPMVGFPAIQAREEIPLLRFSELKRAAYQTHADWQYPIYDGQPLHSVLLPDIQQCRQILRAVAVQTRADIAEGKIDQAIEKITVGLGANKHLEQSPFLIVKLVAAANATMFLDLVRELQQQENAPNLYWALASLPQPLVGLRDSIDWERAMITSSIPELRNLEQVRSADEWHALGRRIIAVLQELGPESQSRFATPEAADKALIDFLARARAEYPKLVGADADSKRIAAMSDDEVGVRYFAIRFFAATDHSLKLMLLPPAVALPKWQAWSDELKRRQESEPELGSVGAFFLPTTIWSLQRKVAALQAVEAVRDYAARNTNQLPKSLDAIIELPVPNDLMTGQPFQYRVEADAAYLSADAIRVNGMDQHGINYRIRIR